MAFFTRTLPRSLQTEAYGAFLQGVDVDEDRESKRRCLASAVDHGLDVQAIVKSAVRRTLNDLDGQGQNPSLGGTIDWDTVPSLDELARVRILDWLTLDPALFCEALQQANMLIRHFLIHGRPKAAHSVLDVLPLDFLELMSSGYPGSAEDIQEFIKHRDLLVGFDKYAKWCEHHYCSPARGPTFTQTAYVQHSVSYSLC